jgi:hypothetical protein
MLGVTPGDTKYPPAPKSIALPPEPTNWTKPVPALVMAGVATLALSVLVELPVKRAVLPSAQAWNASVVVLLQVLPPVQLPVPPTPAVAPLASQMRSAACAGNAAALPGWQRKMGWFWF